MTYKQVEMFRYAASIDLKYNKLTYSGAIRSGKSVFAMWGFGEYIIQHMDKGERYHFAILGASDGAIEKNIWHYIVSYFKMRRIRFKHIKGEIRIGNNILLTRYGANNAKSFEAFQGATLKGVLIDESAILNSYALEVAEQRVITYKGDSKIIHCTNPESSESSAYYKKYVNGDDYYYIHLTLLDNPIFEQSDIDYFRKIYDEVTFNRKILGKWVVASGAIYKMTPITCSLRHANGVVYDYIVGGVDEGRIDAITCVLVGVKDDTYTILDQFYYKEESSDVLEAKDELETWLERKSYQFQYRHGFTVYFETNPGFLYNMFSNNVDLNPEIDIRKVNKKKEDYKSKTAIQERIDVTNFLIRNEQLFISDKITHLKSSFENAVYDKNSNRLDDGTFDVDSLDAFEYAIKADIKTLIRDMYDLEKIKRRRKTG